MNMPFQVLRRQQQIIIALKYCGAKQIAMYLAFASFYQYHIVQNTVGARA
jgi:hypothetical protein